jgi:hypothetical protein
MEAQSSSSVCGTFVTIHPHPAEAAGRVRQGTGEGLCDAWAMSEPSHQSRWSHEPDAADFYAAAVYGSIVAAALTGAFREEHASSQATALALLSTMAVFWLAHLWSALVGERIHLGLPFSLRHAAEVGRAEWPLLESAFAPTAILLLGWAGVFGQSTASTVALVVCVLQLFAWGFLVGRRAYDHWWSAGLSGLGNGVLGIALVSLEIAVLH